LLFVYLLACLFVFFNLIGPNSKHSGVATKVSKKWQKALKALKTGRIKEHLRDRFRVKNQNNQAKKRAKTPEPGFTTDPPQNEVERNQESSSLCESSSSSSDITMQETSNQSSLSEPYDDSISLTEYQAHTSYASRSSEPNPFDSSTYQSLTSNEPLDGLTLSPSDTYETDPSCESSLLKLSIQETSNPTDDEHQETHSSSEFRWSVQESPNSLTSSPSETQETLQNCSTSSPEEQEHFQWESNSSMPDSFQPSSTLSMNETLIQSPNGLTFPLQTFEAVQNTSEPDESNSLRSESYTPTMTNWIPADVPNNNSVVSEAEEEMVLLDPVSEKEDEHEIIYRWNVLQNSVPEQLLTFVLQDSRVYCYDP